jgi:hypothetical protein
MKNLIVGFLLGVSSFACHAQPNGFEYVIQTDFGDAQDTTYPTATQQWQFSPNWKNLQANFNATDWYGPHFSPIGPQAHGKYVMLDDTQNDYGAVAGNIYSLEYRLVECEFDYHLYDATNPTGNAHGGTLYVLLADKDTDIRSFDPDHPADFAANGDGQVLFAFNFRGGAQGSRLDPWPKLSESNTQDASYRQTYALGKSATGTPGSPFTWVGLVWRSVEFYEDRILIDNFHLKDICPDCVFLLPNPTVSGCMESSWVTPIRNNYYYYTAYIHDSTTNDLIFQQVHHPATFDWDGVGNVGSWLGNAIAYGQA